MTKRNLTVAVFVQAAMAIAACHGTAQAQSYPSKPLTMVAPFAAGGTTDAIARILAEGMRADLGQPVVVENVGGAGGMTGAHRVARAAPDGYQFVLGSLGTHAQIQSFYKKPFYDAASDFEPVALVTDQSIVLVARNDFPADSFQQFVAYAKANQKTLQYGSAGTGGSNHLACLLLNTALGIEITHVPYRSGAQAMQDLLGGRIDYQCPTGAVAVPQIAGKTVKALAILSKNRSAILPSLPSAHEQGLTDFDIPTWYAVFLPKGTPKPIVQRLHAAVMATIDKPDVQKRMREIGADVVEPERRSPEYLARFVVSEIKRWEGPIKASGVQAD
ncbi:MAG: tripartite tricarboxylate transporter substrate binding protein [Xanthobacteraceae bacterium]|nr:tripartite tricarboxylate transporter substrate binding protein [Xanthobacteraceae bacterium]